MTRRELTGAESKKSAECLTADIDIDIAHGHSQESGFPMLPVRRNLYGCLQDLSTLRSPCTSFA